MAINYRAVCTGTGIVWTSGVVGDTMKWPNDFINKVICGDCLEVMKHIPDGAVDLVVTDPPYGEGRADWDKAKPNEYVFDLFRAALKNGGGLYYWGFWGHAEYVLGNAKRVGFTPRSCIVWWFKTGRPQNYSYREDTENCWYFSLGEPTRFDPSGYLEPYLDNSNYARYGRDGKHPGSVWEHTRLLHNHPETVAHPTQKPIALIAKMVAISSVVGDIILDPFAGSGTTLVAAKQLGRKYIGIEINPDYCKIAEDRLRQEELFG